MTNPVVTFLTTRNGYAFDEGVAVFAMYTANRFAVERVRRSRDMRLLQQELKKLAHIPGLKPVNGASAPAVTKESVSVPKEEIVETPKVATSEETSEETSEAKDTVTFAQLQHYKFTRYEDMPTPETQQLWLRNNDRWHRKIDLFAKMKLMPEGEELAAVRNELVEVSREHRECWKLIDRLYDEFHHPAAAPPKARHPAAAEGFNVSTASAYISKAIKKGCLTDKQFLELQRRVDAMIAARVELKPETIGRLKAIGVSI